MHSLYQQYRSAKIISNCCDTVNGADIELIIVGCRFSLLAINGGVARGCGIKYQNHPCPSCALEYPIGQETEYLICVAY